MPTLWERFKEAVFSILESDYETIISEVSKRLKAQLDERLSETPGGQVQKDIYQYITDSKNGVVANIAKVSGFTKEDYEKIVDGKSGRELEEAQNEFFDKFSYACAEKIKEEKNYDIFIPEWKQTIIDYVNEYSNFTNNLKNHKGEVPECITIIAEDINSYSKRLMEIIVDAREPLTKDTFSEHEITKIVQLIKIMKAFTPALASEDLEGSLLLEESPETLNPEKMQVGLPLRDLLFNSSKTDTGEMALSVSQRLQLQSLLSIINSAKPITDMDTFSRRLEFYGLIIELQKQDFSVELLPQYQRLYQLCLGIEKLPHFEIVLTPILFKINEGLKLLPSPDARSEFVRQIGGEGFQKLLLNGVPDAVKVEQPKLDDDRVSELPDVPPVLADETKTSKIVVDPDEVPAPIGDKKKETVPKAVDEVADVMPLDSKGKEKTTVREQEDKRLEGTLTTHDVQTKATDSAGKDKKSQRGSAGAMKQDSDPQVIDEVENEHEDEMVKLREAATLIREDDIDFEIDPNDLLKRLNEIREERNSFYERAHLNLYMDEFKETDRETYESTLYKDDEEISTFKVTTDQVKVEGLTTSSMDASVLAYIATVNPDWKGEPPAVDKEGNQIGLKVDLLNVDESEQAELLSEYQHLAAHYGLHLEAPGLSSFPKL